MPKCLSCGSRKAGQDRICWKCNPNDRRYKDEAIIVKARQKMTFKQRIQSMLKTNKGELPIHEQEKK